MIMLPGEKAISHAFLYHIWKQVPAWEAFTERLVRGAIRASRLPFAASQLRVLYANHMLKNRKINMLASRMN